MVDCSILLLYFNRTVAIICVDKNEYMFQIYKSTPIIHITKTKKNTHFFVFFHILYILCEYTKCEKNKKTMLSNSLRSYWKLKLTLVI